MFRRNCSIPEDCKSCSALGYLHVLMFVFLFLNFVARSKQKYASIYHCGSQLRIKKAPALKRLPQCPMWPYYRAFHDFACFTFLDETLESIYHCVSSKLQNLGVWQIWPCFRVFLLLSSIFELRKRGLCRRPARDFFVAVTAPPLARRIMRGLPQPPQITILEYYP